MKNMSSFPSSFSRALAARTAPAWLIAGAVGLGLSAQPAQAQQPVQPLVRMHSSLQFQATSEVSLDEDLFVSTSGLSQGEVTTNGPGVPIAWLTTLKTATASPQQLADLRSTFIASSIGQLTGACALDVQFFASGTYEINWYGRVAGRRTDLTVSLVPGASSGSTNLPLCPPQVCRVLLTLIAYARDTLGLADLAGVACNTVA